MEKPASVWTRRIIIAAFWAVVACLGLPHWTWTTSIHRASLPLESMNAWAEGKCRLHYPLTIALDTPALAPPHAVHLLSTLDSLINPPSPARLHSFHVVPEATNASAPAPALTVRLDPASNSAAPSAELHSWLPVMHVQHPVHSPSDVDDLAKYLAQEISRVFDDENAALWHLIKDTSFSKALPSPPLSPESISMLDKRTTRSFKYAPNYHLTFSLFTPGASPSAWEINQAVEEYISPLLAPLSAISDFTIDTQVQLYASFSPSIAGPVFNAEKNHWTLGYGDLTGFVNAAEWPLSPSIGSGPTINFVLYVASPEKRPLWIEETSGISWIIPQWGGVQIHNAPSSKPDELTLDDLRPDMLVFAAQVASLLGVPPSPPSLSLRISSLTRERATALILSASSTLGALSRLTLKLTSIAIPASVAKSVDETLSRLEQACSDLSDGRFQSALENARVAETEVEKAFFEPSMVGQVYFPEEHKVAVYVPLLGPMAVPLVMSALKEFRNFRARKTKAA
ncbi:gpi transamidase component pig-s [Lecanosticta acicola]|uniref:Gpi transamidase component pig-s n=1 Tax=Lecanosticta acicola TaxID=111012 RepID=A0AAI9ECU8_9PEZI|nr:gpi transamidase component pig-s [Lecanosticta acicola]